MRVGEFGKGFQSVDSVHGLSDIAVFTLDMVSMPGENGTVLNKINIIIFDQVPLILVLLLVARVLGPGTGDLRQMGKPHSSPYSQFQNLPSKI